MKKVVALLLVLAVVGVGVVLARDLYAGRGVAEPNESSDHSWHCTQKRRFCFRAASECHVEAMTTNDACESQPQAACFVSRIIIKDTTEPQCYATVSICEVFRSAASRDPELDEITSCDGYDAATRDRRVLGAKVLLGVLGTIGFTWTAFVGRSKLR